jgi:NitT/TauT family transport system ATP-binding protein
VGVKVEGANHLFVEIERMDYGGVRGLRNVQFAAAAGEVLALLAPSGTGKTTALRIATGLDTDFTGAVQRPAGRLGTVFQEPRLLPWLTIAGNLRLVQPRLTTPEIETFLGLAGLENCAGRMPKELSLGMARRVALARALCVRPALLVMDEPFASLDARLGAQLGRDVTAHARGIGATVLLATHDLDQALAIADRILVLKGAAPATLTADLRAASCSAGALREEFPFLDAG